jgi:hypothetical protein
MAVAAALAVLASAPTALAEGRSGHGVSRAELAGGLLTSIGATFTTIAVVAVPYEYMDTWSWLNTFYFVMGGTTLVAGIVTLVIQAASHRPPEPSHEQDPVIDAVRAPPTMTPGVRAPTPIVGQEVQATNVAPEAGTPLSLAGLDSLIIRCLGRNETGIERLTLTVNIEPPSFVALQRLSPAPTPLAAECIQLVLRTFRPSPPAPNRGASRARNHPTRLRRRR